MKGTAWCNSLLRRLLEFLIALVAFLIFLPLLIVVAIIVAATSPGPAIFVQTRIGRGERPFRIFKFRTMIDRKHIDQLKEKAITSDVDPRITKIGKILRKTSIDELPQLWNVVLGEMSFVGPRPTLPDQSRAIPARLKPRFDVRPGITGLAQASGRRGLAWPETLAKDVEYTEVATPGLDLKLIWATVFPDRSQKITGSAEGNWRNFVDKDF